MILRNNTASEIIQSISSNGLKKFGQINMLSNKSLKLWTFFVLYVLSKGYLIVRRLIDTDREIKNTNTDPQCNVQSRGQIHFSLCLLVKNKSEPTKSSSPSNQQIIITLRKTVLKANLTVRRFLKPFFKGIVLRPVRSYKLGKERVFWCPTQSLSV